MIQQLLYYNKFSFQTKIMKKYEMYKGKHDPETLREYRAKQNKKILLQILRHLF